MGTAIIRTKTFRWAFGGAEHQTGFDVLGMGPDALLLPALSSVSVRAEMHPLAHILKSKYRCIIPDWPGFGAISGPKASLTPDLLASFLRVFVAQTLTAPALAVAAGHASAYLMQVAREVQPLFSHIVLVAPTWRGPLPTAMGEHRRPLWRSVRRIVERPVIGPLIYRLNVNRPVLRKMMRAHVYANPKFITEGLLSRKAAVTRRPRARFATAAFVTGGLDLVLDRSSYLKFFEPPLPAPVLVLIGAATPRKSRAEMDALAALPVIEAKTVPGALAAHEEYPQAIADAIQEFLHSAPNAAAVQAQTRQ